MWRRGPRLFFSGLALGAALALCISHARTAGLPDDPAGKMPPRALSLEKHTLIIEDDVGNRDNVSACDKLEQKQVDLLHWGPMVVDCHFKKVSKKVISSDFAWILGLITLVLWHTLRFVHHETHLPLMRNVSLGVIIFNFFYHTGSNFPDIVKTNPFTCSCILLVLECTVRRLMDALRRKRNTYALAPRGDATNGAERKEDGENERTISNQYEDLTTPFTKILLLFTCQATLGFYYVYELNHRSSDNKLEGISPWRWFIGVCLCTIAGESELGSAFEADYWFFLLNQKELIDKQRRIYGCITVTYRAEVWIRAVMSLIVNMIIRRIILGTAPIFLGVESPMDFIKDCLAVFFITKLDDMEQTFLFEDMKAQLDKEEVIEVKRRNSIREGTAVSEDERDVDGFGRAKMPHFDRRLSVLQKQIEQLREERDGTQRC